MDGKTKRYAKNEKNGIIMHRKKTGLENKLTKSNKGGKRINSGRKKADYETKTIFPFRVRLEFVEPIKRWSNIMFRSILKSDVNNR